MFFAFMKSPLKHGENKEIKRRKFWFIKNYRHSWFQNFALFWILYVFLWVIPQRLNFICRRFGTLFHLHRHLPVYEEGTVFRNVGIYNSDAGESPKRKHTKLLALHTPLEVVIYRVIQEESAILWEMIVCVILSKNVHMNMGPILDGYEVMTAWNLE